MSLKENISAAINSDINAQISSDAATNISEEVNSHISLKKLSLQERGEIINVNNVTYSTVHDNIDMYNNFVADDYYASKSWVLSKNYLTKEDIGDIEITNNIEELLNNKADKDHNHNDLYYTKDVIDTTNNLLKEELTNKIPTKISQLVNDSNYTTATQLNKVTELIPNTATVNNQLADKNFVNSSISTATAEFRGTVEDLESLNSITANINDYAFYKHVDANGNTLFDRYKFTDKWEYEYTLNNSSFTADQWATINSGITENSIPTKTSELINDSNFATIDAIPTKTSELTNDSSFITTEEVPTETFLCKYRVTTYQEIQDAIDAGKWPYLYLKITDTILRCYRYNGTYSNTHLFISVYDGNSENNKCSVNSSNVWSRSSVTNLVGSASEAMITGRTHVSWGISTRNYDSAVRHALCDTDNSTSYNPAYTDEQKSAARNKIGAVGTDILSNYVDLSSDQEITGTKIFETVPKLSKTAYVNSDVILPDEYQLVEYIQSSGVEYIDTNSRIIANTRFTCTWGSVFNNGSFVASSTENKGYGQGNPSGSSPNISGGGRLQNGVVTFWFSGSNYSTSLGSSVSTSVYTDIITTSENTLNFSMTDIITNNVFTNTTLTNFTIYPVNNMFLFRDSSGQYPFYSAKKIYDVKFETRASSSEDFVVVKHLIPCYRKSDNVCGFYDIIGNEFYTNKGSGTFIAGSDVVDGKLLYDLGFNYNSVLSELKSITGYNSSKTQVLKNVNGIFKWVNE